MNEEKLAILRDHAESSHAKYEYPRRLRDTMQTVRSLIGSLETGKWTYLRLEWFDHTAGGTRQLSLDGPQATQTKRTEFSATMVPALEQYLAEMQKEWERL